MIVHPSIGQRVQLWYAAKWHGWAVYHGKRGVVVGRSSGPGPRNHMIEVEGRKVIVPCGNITKEPKE